MDYRHFSGYERGSKFKKLSGDQQRAIETQANIDVEAYRISRHYKPAMLKEGIEQSLFDMLCNEYANKTELEIKKLVIFESKALYFHPMTKDRMEYYQKLAEERAKSMDKLLDIQMKRNIDVNSR